MVQRQELADRVVRALRDSPVVAIIGPRQCGKTTLARGIAARRKGEVLDLENPADRRRLEQPMTALEPLRGLVVIDEVQTLPELFPVLRVLSDRKPLPARFLLLGSASPDLVRGSSETLAGRVAFVDMGGFDLGDVGTEKLRRLWLRGGFPRSYLARSEASSFAWRQDFVRTFLERDLRQMGIETPPEALRRLWTMVAHYHGQIWNGSEVARSLGVAHTTVKRHVDVLSGALTVRQLQPYYANLGKRQVKSPKAYIRDAGLLHALLGLETFAALESSPRLGASWEGFVVEEVARTAGERNIFFWATQAGAELDLLILSQGRRFGVEVKYADAPTVTKSMHVARTDLALERLWVVHPGRQSYALAQGIDAVGIGLLRSTLAAAGIGTSPRRARRAPEPTAL